MTKLFQPNPAKETPIALNLAWIGLASNIALLINFALLKQPIVQAMGIAVTGTAIFVIILGKQYDDFFLSLRNAGMRWGMSTIAIYLFLHAVILIFGAGKAVGRTLAGGDYGGIPATSSDLFLDGYLLAIIASLAFFIGFAWARLVGTVSN